MLSSLIYCSKDTQDGHVVFTCERHQVRIEHYQKSANLAG